MIQPLGQNLNIQSSSRLKPVEVPHFTGITKIKEKPDSFEKEAKGAPSAKQDKKAKTAKANKRMIGKQEKAAKKAVKEGKTTPETKAKKPAAAFNSKEFKEDAAEVLNAAQNGAQEGFNVLVDVTHKGIEFTGSVIRSLYKDVSGIFREKGTNIIKIMDV